MKKLISLPKNPTTTDQIGGVVKIHPKDEWYDPVFANYENIPKYTTCSAPFGCSSLPPETKIIRPKISFIVNTTYIETSINPIQ